MFRKNGFTLIECLVVVIVVVLMVSLALPPFKTPKVSTYNMACLNNLRSLMIAETAYAIEHQDAFSRPGPMVEGSWAPGSDPTAEPNSDALAEANFAQGVLFEYMGDDVGAYACPTGIDKLKDDRFGDGMMYRTYSKNGLIGAGKDSEGLEVYVEQGLVKQKISEVKHASELMVFGEEAGDRDAYRDLNISSIMDMTRYYADSSMLVAHYLKKGSKGDIIGTFHNGGDPESGSSNVAFVDGHVSTQSPIGSVFPHDGYEVYNVQRLAFDRLPVDVSGPTTSKVSGSR